MAARKRQQERFKTKPKITCNARMGPRELKQYCALDEATMLADRIGVMSARPGRIIDVVETRWPRDRDSRIIEHGEFGAITARLWKTLREESLKTIGRTIGSAEST